MSLQSEDCICESSCPVCLRNLVKGQGRLGKPETCEHFFCFSCIYEWSKNVNTCPVDRIGFNNIEVYSSKKKLLRKVYCPDHSLQQVLQDSNDVTYCEVCHECNNEDRLLLCDGCDKGFHLDCLSPLLSQVPVGDWYCSRCLLVIASQYENNSSHESSAAATVEEEEEEEKLEEETVDDAYDSSSSDFLYQPRRNSRPSYLQVLETDADSWDSSDSDVIPPLRRKCHHFLTSPSPDRTYTASNDGRSVPCDTSFKRSMQSTAREDVTNVMAGWDQPCSSQQVIACNNGENLVQSNEKSYTDVYSGYSDDEIKVSTDVSVDVQARLRSHKSAASSVDCFVSRHSIPDTKGKVKNNDALYRKKKKTGRPKRTTSKRYKGKQRKQRRTKKKYAKRKKRRLLTPKVFFSPASPEFSTCGHPSRRLAHSDFTPPFLLRQIGSRARTAATHSPFQFKRAVIEAYRHSSTTEGLTSAQKILSHTKNEGRQKHLTPRQVVQSPTLPRTHSTSSIRSSCSVMDEDTGLRQTSKYATQSYTASSQMLRGKHHLISSGAAQEVARRIVTRRKLHYSCHTNIHDGSCKFNNHDSALIGQPSTSVGVDILTRISSDMDNLQNGQNIIQRDGRVLSINNASENVSKGNSQCNDQFASGEVSSDLTLGKRKAVRTSSCVTDVEEMLLSGSKSKNSRYMVTRSLKSLSSSYSISDHQYLRILERATARVESRCTRFTQKKVDALVKMYLDAYS